MWLMFFSAPQSLPVQLQKLLQGVFLKSLVVSAFRLEDVTTVETRYAVVSLREAYYKNLKAQFPFSAYFNPFFSSLQKGYVAVAVCP